jgi:hypothetical protein
VRPGETKSQRFERIAERRVNEALRALRLLGNLSDRRNYAYTEDQVALMLGAIEQGCRALKSKFKAEPGNDRAEFKFK